jgi:hypothetical protein
VIARDPVERRRVLLAERIGEEAADVSAEFPVTDTRRTNADL